MTHREKELIRNKYKYNLDTDSRIMNEAEANKIRKEKLKQEKPTSK